MVRGDSVQLTTLRSLSLDDDEQRLVVEWLRGSLDLVMRVRRRPPPSAREVRRRAGRAARRVARRAARLIAHTARRVRGRPALDAATGAAAAPAAEATAAKLAADARKAAAEAAVAEKLVVVLDLDRTLWQGSAADFADDDAFALQARRRPARRRRRARLAGDADRTAHLDLFPEVRGVIELLRDAGCTVALASLGHAAAAKAPSARLRCRCRFATARRS